MVRPLNAPTRGSGPQDDGPYVDVAQAAHLLRLSEISVRRFLTQQRLRRFKCGARTLLLRREVLGLVKEV
jgi:hypothetical protein